VAAVVTALPNGTIYEMPAVNYEGPGPQTFGPNIKWSSSGFVSVFGRTTTYGFGPNGAWSGMPPMAGTNDHVNTSMTFTLAQDVAGVGGLLNWISSPEQASARMSIFNSAGDLLDTFQLRNETPNTFYGFARAESDIRSFSLAGGYIGLRSLAVDGVLAPVPEPSTWAMLLLGFGVIGAGMRRRRRPAFA
jgi:hypothetical protein